MVTVPSKVLAEEDSEGKEKWAPSYLRKSIITENSKCKGRKARVYLGILGTTEGQGSSGW